MGGNDVLVGCGKQGEKIQLTRREASETDMHAPIANCKHSYLDFLRIMAMDIISSAARM